MEQKFVLNYLIAPWDPLQLAQLQLQEQLQNCLQHPWPQVVPAVPPAALCPLQEFLSWALA